MPPTRLIIPFLSVLLAFSLYIQYVQLPLWGDSVVGKQFTSPHSESIIRNNQRRHQNGSTINATYDGNLLNSNKSNENTCQRLSNGGPLHIVWAWHDSPTWHVMNHTLSMLPSHLQVEVYCGSSACAAAARDVISGSSALSSSSSNNKCRSVQLLVAPILAQDTPLEEWVGDHILAKLLSGPYYEETLQVGLQLAVLYKYGGAVLSLLNGPNSIATQSALKEMLPQTAADDMALLADAAGHWVKPGIGGGLYAVAASPSNKSVIDAMMKEMLIQYQWPRYVKSNWPVQISWDSLCARVDGCANAKRKWIYHQALDDTSSVVSVEKRHYGTLAYQARWYHTKHVLKASDMNKGDEMQGLGGLQFLPRLDAFVERDRLDVVDVIASANFTPSGLVSPDTKSRLAVVPTTVFFNAWWASPTWIWPPPGKLDPILVSMHLHWDSTKQDVNRSKEFMNHRWPIGARDTETHAFLQTIGVHSIFTACMTMTLLPSWSQERDSRERTNEILIVDVSSPKAMQSLPLHIRTRAKKLTARMVDKDIVDDRVARYIEAHKMKIRLQKAKLVITQRLHIALPAASMGTPVILIMDEDMPGGGGAAGLARFSGLQAAVHCFQTTGDGPAALAAFDWDSPPPNPNPDLLQKKRNVLRVLAMCHGVVTDSARKFGVIPASWEYPLEKDTCEGESDSLLDSSIIHIATTVDSAMLDEDAVLSSWIHTLYKSNPTERFAFYFLTNGLNEKQRCLVRWMTLRWFPDSHVFTIPMDDALRNHHNPPSKHVTTASPTPLLLPQLLPCVKRLLWVDLDTIVLKPVRSIWTDWETMPSCGIAARSLLDNASFLALMGRAYNKTSPEEFWKKSSNNRPGFDTGVMLLNLVALRESLFVETVAEHWSNELGGSDQVSMNMQCNGTHGELDSVWNVFVGSPNDPVHGRFKEWSIVNFQGKGMPWNTRHPSSEHYEMWKNYSLSLIDALYGPPSL